MDFSQCNNNSIEQIEEQLDSFDSGQRKVALRKLMKKVRSGAIKFAEPQNVVNLHCHTFFSFNSLGYSPSKFAYLAKKAGLSAVGIVDFDVLEGLDEFLDACRIVGLRGCVGLESRVFVPEFADKVINSPGEPGIAYHMGMGFVRRPEGEKQREFLRRLKDTAGRRNRELMDRVNKYLSPVELDYGKDVESLTPAGNPTERHICLAYARKAAKIFGGEDLHNFWSEKLRVDVKQEDLPESRNLLNTIRAKTMKEGGVGYVRPDGGAFPKLTEMNEFVLEAGGIPTMTWLDGTSEGEKEIERLIETAMASGTAALNIIPDRNFKPGVKDKKLENLYRVAELAAKLELPVIVGTEMNSFGQKFADDFASAELKPLVPMFMRGAYIVYAHSALSQTCGVGYVGQWAKENFKTTEVKNKFFEQVGRKLEPGKEDALKGLGSEASAGEILKRIGG